VSAIKVTTYQNVSFQTNANLWAPFSATIVSGGFTGSREERERERGCGYASIPARGSLFPRRTMIGDERCFLGNYIHIGQSPGRTAVLSTWNARSRGREYWRIWKLKMGATASCLPSSSLLSSPFTPFLPLQLVQLRSLESAVSSLSGVRGGAPAANAF